MLPTTRQGRRDGVTTVALPGMGQTTMRQADQTTYDAVNRIQKATMSGGVLSKYRIPLTAVARKHTKKQHAAVKVTPLHRLQDASVSTRTAVCSKMHIHNARASTVPTKYKALSRPAAVNMADGWETLVNREECGEKGVACEK